MAGVVPREPSGSAVYPSSDIDLRGKDQQKRLPVVGRDDPSTQNRR
jgi:hypothetical protein